MQISCLSKGPDICFVIVGNNALKFQSHLPTNCHNEYWVHNPFSKQLGPKNAVMTAKKNWHSTDRFILQECSLCGCEVMRSPSLGAESCLDWFSFNSGQKCQGINYYAAFHSEKTEAPAVCVGGKRVGAASECFLSRVGMLISIYTIIIEALYIQYPLTNQSGACMSMKGGWLWDFCFLSWCLHKN